MAGYLTCKRTVLRSAISIMLCCLSAFPTFCGPCPGAAAPAAESVDLSTEEKEKLVTQGVTQYEKGDIEAAKKTLETGHF